METTVPSQPITRDDVQVLSTDVRSIHHGHWWHIQIGDDYYIVSAVDLHPLPNHRDSETMAFPADAEGEPTTWGEVAFVPYKDHEACIADLLNDLNGGSR